MIKSEAELEAFVDKRIAHKGKNTDTVLEFTQKEMSKIDKTQALIQQEQKFQSKKIDDNHIELMGTIKSLSSTFATKVDLDNIKEKVNGHSGYFKWFLTGFGAMFLTAIGKAIGIY